MRCVSRTRRRCKFNTIFFRKTALTSVLTLTAFLGMGTLTTTFVPAAVSGMSALTITTTSILSWVVIEQQNAVRQTDKEMYGARTRLYVLLGIFWAIFLAVSTHMDGDATTSKG